MTNNINKDSIDANKIKPTKHIIKKISDSKVKTKIELSEKLKKLNKLKR